MPADIGAIEPWRASSDGFVKHKKSAGIIRTVSYRRSVSSVRVYAHRNLMPQFSYDIKTIHKFFTWENVLSSAQNHRNCV